MECINHHEPLIKLADKIDRDLQQSSEQLSHKDTAQIKTCMKLLKSIDDVNELISSLEKEKKFVQDAINLQNSPRSLEKVSCFLSKHPRSKPYLLSKEILIKQKNDLEEFEKDVKKFTKAFIQPNQNTISDLEIRKLREKIDAANSELELIGSSLSKKSKIRIINSQKSLECASIRDALDSVPVDNLLNSIQYFLKSAYQKKNTLASNYVQLQDTYDQKIDVCFLIESNAPFILWISALEQIVNGMELNIQKRFPEASVRLACGLLKVGNMGFGKAYLSIPFTESARDFTASLKAMKKQDFNLNAGNQTGSGFEKVLDLKWSSSTKILFHIICFGRDYRIDRNIVGECKCLGINYHVITNKDDNILSANLDKIWKDVSCDSISDRVEPEYCFKKANVWENEFPNDLSETLIKFLEKVREPRVSKAVKQPLKKIQLKNRMTIIHEDDGNEQESKGFPTKIHWDLPIKFWREESGKLISILIHKTIEEIIEERFTLTESECTIFIQPNVFAKGEFNNAYPALLGKTNHKLIAKYPIQINPDRREHERLMKLELKKHAIVLALARKFNANLQKLSFNPWARIVYIHNFLFRSPSGICILEGYIDGKFEKYSNNLDYLDTSRETRHLTAFAHFSYIHSDCNYLVSDFQGVHNLLLTDPVIHSSRREFYDTGDFGSIGFIEFFKKHECNIICKLLGLKKPDLNYKICDPWVEREDHKRDSRPRFKCVGRVCNQLLTFDENDVWCKFCRTFFTNKTKKTCAKCFYGFTYDPMKYLFLGLGEPNRCVHCDQASIVDFYDFNSKFNL